MSLYAADYAASGGMQTTASGGTQDNYYMLHGETRHYSDPWHWRNRHRRRLPYPWYLPVDGPSAVSSDD
jgi:malyl-CoA/(S)-citramalyl-CoA lyase